MKESYMEGIANRHGPRPSASGSNDRRAVSMRRGEGVSWVLSTESIAPGLPVHLLVVIGEMPRPLGREGVGKPAVSETPCERGGFMHENRESPDSALATQGPVGKGQWRIPPMCTLPGGLTWA